LSIANLVAGAGEFPKSLRVVDWGVGDVARVLAVVDETKVIGAWNTLLEIGSEDILLENTLIYGGVEERGLLLWLNYARLVMNSQDL
jgi:hypothetical protein